jgi:nucleoside-diphosphate-sugar epimerase
MKRILLAGSTGYLGVFIAKELQQRSSFLRAIARNLEKLRKNDIKANEILKAELTDPESIKECCKGIDIVISTVGITKQKDGLSYMDVDYQANMNLLKEAKKSGVRNLFMFQS